MLGGAVLCSAGLCCALRGSAELGRAVLGGAVLYWAVLCWAQTSPPFIVRVYVHLLIKSLYRLILECKLVQLGILTNLNFELQCHT